MAASFGRLPPWVGALLTGGAVVLLAAANGGYFSSVWPFAALAFGATGLLLAAISDVHGPPPAAVWFACALAALAAWTALTALWSSEPGTSLVEAERALLYLCAVAAFVVGRRGLVVGTIGGATVVSAWALVERMTTTQALDPSEGRLLVGPIGYANALGALAAMGIAGAVIAASRSRGWTRLAFTACLVPLVPALVLTNSRGAWLACAAGVVLGLLMTYRSRAEAAAAVAGAAAVLVVGLSIHASVLGNRAAYWGVARDAAGSHLVTGSGGGTFGAVYALRLPGGPPAQDAHSLYLETLDELGLVGLTLLLAALALPLVVGLARAGTSPTAIAVYVVFILHAGIDWDWEMPVVTVAGLAAAVCLLTSSARADTAEGGTPV